MPFQWDAASGEYSYQGDTDPFSSPAGLTAASLLDDTMRRKQQDNLMEQAKAADDWLGKQYTPPTAGLVQASPAPVAVANQLATADAEGYGQPTQEKGNALGNFNGPPMGLPPTRDYPTMGAPGVGQQERGNAIGNLNGATLLPLQTTNEPPPAWTVPSPNPFANTKAGFLLGRNDNPEAVGIATNANPMEIASNVLGAPGQLTHVIDQRLGVPQQIAGPLELAANAAPFVAAGPGGFATKIATTAALGELGYQGSEADRRLGLPQVPVVGGPIQGLGMALAPGAAERGLTGLGQIGTAAEGYVGRAFESGRGISSAIEGAGLPGIVPHKATTAPMATRGGTADEFRPFSTDQLVARVKENQQLIDGLEEKVDGADQNHPNVKSINAQLENLYPNQEKLLTELQKRGWTDEIPPYNPNVTSVPAGTPISQIRNNQGGFGPIVPGSFTAAPEPIRGIGEGVTPEETAYLKAHADAVRSGEGRGFPPIGATGSMAAMTTADQIPADIAKRISNEQNVRNGMFPEAATPPPPVGAAPTPPEGVPPATPNRVNTESAAELARNQELLNLSRQNLNLKGNGNVPPPSGREFVAGANGELAPANPIDEMAKKLLGGLGADEKLPPGQPPTGTGTGNGESVTPTPEGVAPSTFQKAVSMATLPIRIPTQIMLTGWHFGRVGAANLLSHPTNWFPGVKSLAEMTINPKSSEAISDAIRAKPLVGAADTQLTRPNGQIVDVSPIQATTLRARDEYTLPTMADKISRNIPILSRFANANAAFLNNLRDSIYNTEAMRSIRNGDGINPDGSVDVSWYKDLYTQLSHDTGHATGPVFKEGTPGALSTLGVGPSAWTARLESIFDMVNKPGTPNPMGTGPRAMAVRNFLAVGGLMGITSAVGQLTGAPPNIPFLNKDPINSAYGTVESSLFKASATALSGAQTRWGGGVGYDSLFRYAINQGLAVRHAIDTGDWKPAEQVANSYWKGEFGPVPQRAINLLLGPDGLNASGPFSKDWKGDSYTMANVKDENSNFGKVVSTWGPISIKNMKDAVKEWGPVGGVARALPGITGSEVQTTPTTPAFQNTLARDQKFTPSMTGRDLRGLTNQLTPYYNWRGEADTHLWKMAQADNPNLQQFKSYNDYNLSAQSLWKKMGGNPNTMPEPQDLKQFYGNRKQAEQSYFRDNPNIAKAYDQAYPR